MRKAAIFLILITATFCGAVPSEAATQRECLKALNLGKRYEEERKQAFALFQRGRSEGLRCDFLVKSRRYVSQAEKAANACHEHEPNLAEKLKADAASTLKELDSAKYECRPKSKAELQAEKRCLAAREATNAKDAVFKQTLAAYNANKTKLTQCTFLKASIDYLTETDTMLKLCEPIHAPDGPSQIAKNRETLQKSREAQTKFCI
ncbi:hypothetical protein [Microvirga terrestris]|uniref:DUF1311 domain-containing protein n=1 Tax=Microvirga terrestris TaxID=2791024 RepID=A0ABS0HUB1_9HYPH|nr:hypothetical protein [Microvirga terrestris]MBF9197080.1 hypothetical protein [Microvirga terrestris]